MKRIKLNKLLKEIILSKNDIVIDLGGGRGILSKILPVDVKKLIILDISRKKLKSAKRKKIHVIQGDICSLPIKKDSIDKVLCINVLHHVKDLKAAVEEIRRILKKGGTIFVLDFHRKSLMGRMINLYEKTMFNPGLIDPQHLQKLFKNKGFKGSTKMISNHQYLYLGKKN